MGRWPRSSFMLVSFVVFMVLYPWFLDAGPWQLGFELGGMCLMVFSAVYATGTRSFRTGLPALALFALCSVTCVVWPRDPAFMLLCAVSLAIHVYVVVVLLRNLLSHHVVSGDTLCSALAVYLLLGTTFALGFAIMLLLHPAALDGKLHPGRMGSFQFSDVLYFSYCTLTTSGYGDIAPATAGARSLAVLEQICGVFYSGVLIARLVGLYAQEPRSPYSGE